LLAIEDITEGATARSALFASEELFRHVSESGFINIFFFSPDGRIRDANEGFLQLVGYTRADLDKGLVRWDRLTPPEWMEETQWQMSNFNRTGKIGPYEKEYLRKDGSKFWGLFVGARLEEGIGIEFVIDITDQKLAEKLKDEFISIASHELRTPVTGIRAYVDILLQNYHESAELPAPDLLKNMKRLTDRLTDLIRNLLDVSKIREGQMQLNKTWIDLNGLIVALTEDMRRATPGHQLGHQLILELQQGGLFVMADKERISQVLTNLLSNAVKYSPDADKVILSSAREGRMIRIDVRDFGIGLSPEDQKKVFQRFYRTLDTGNRSFPGMGLGLYIAAGIVSQHHGEIRVDSTPGSGSVFTVLLPAE
jgi:PAS domain S-box-containing protein